MLSSLPDFHCFAASLAGTLMANVASDPFWLWQFLGRLHPMMVHFPVALLVVAFIVEFFVGANRKVGLRQGIHIMLTGGALSAVLSVALGLMLAETEAYSGDLLTWHKWTGLATAVLAVVVALLHRSMLRRDQPTASGAYRTLLITTVLGVSVAGHLGASMTHGETFLTEVLPWNSSAASIRNPGFNLTELATRRAEELTAQQVADLGLEVRAILAHNCYKCHSSAKVKGDLRLDKKELIFKGGESGPVVMPGKPEESELLRRVLLPRGHDDAMPPKGEGLAKEDVEILRVWISSGALFPDSLDSKSHFRLAATEPREPTVPAQSRGFENEIDRFVDAYFQERGIEWAEPVNDRVYIRRVFLDIIGLLPSPDEVMAFVSDSRPDKRERLVRRLLSRDDDYAQHWLAFWNDALRNDYTGTGYITGGRSAITEWLYEALRTNKPYDTFVHELISPPDKTSEGFIRGIEWRGTVNASQRVEMQAAQNVSQVFLGLNLKCASCHDSFVSDWKLDDAYAFANIFSESPLEINRCDKPTGRMAQTRILFTSLGEIDSTLDVEAKRKQLADYLVAPRNGRLYRTIVNRIWAQMMGRGIIAPVDEMDNEPWSQDLLDRLAWDFEARGKDLRDLMFRIATSRTYQLPSVELAQESDMLKEGFRFEGMIRRRLSAEQFADAISKIIAPLYPDTPLKNLRFAEEPTFIRASLVRNDALLTALGRPNRENVSTWRSSQTSLLQALELTNGEALNQAIIRGAQRWRAQFGNDTMLVTEIFRHALGREPDPLEVRTALGLLAEDPQGVEDLLWSVVLLPEFQLIF